jgi:hypothetical protein
MIILLIIQSYTRQKIKIFHNYQFIYNNNPLNPLREKVVFLSFFEIILIFLGHLIFNKESSGLILRFFFYYKL